MPVPDYNKIVTTNNDYTWVFYPNAGAPSSGGPTFLNTANLTRDALTSVGVVTPSFATLAGYKLPINNWQRRRITYRTAKGTFVDKAVIASGYYIETCRIEFTRCGGSVDPALWPNVDAENPSQRALNQLIEQIKSGKMQAAVSLAEAHKTAAMVAASATTIVRAIRALRSCRFGEFANALGITVSRKQTDKYYTGVRSRSGVPGSGFRYNSKSKVTRETQEQQFQDFAAQTWLQYSYGWKPLLNDVYSAAEAFAYYFTESNGAWRHGSGRASTYRGTNVRKLASYYANDYAILVRRRHKYGVTYRIPEGVVSPATTFGLSNPLVVAWEIVPFSFVADWFIPIGQTLENLTAYDGLVFLKGYSSGTYSYQNQGKTVVVPGLSSSSGGVTYTCLSSDLKASWSEFFIQRTKLTDFPKVGLPTFKDPRSFAHAASAIALLQSLFLSGGSRKLKL